MSRGPRTGRGAGPEGPAPARPGRVLLVSEVFPPRTGGSGRWYWEIYRRLPRGQVVVAAGEDPRQEAFDRGHDLHVVRVPLALRSWGVSGPGALAAYGRATRALRRLVRDERVRMLHGGRCLPEGLMARALKVRGGVPYVLYAHGEEMNYASASRELSWLARRALRGAEFIVANSRNTARILVERWGLEDGRVRILHPGVDTARFAPAWRSEEARSGLGWGARPVVLTVGRLQKRKGHDQMILALREVRRAIPDVLYAIAGEGEESGSLRELVAREGQGGHVQFLGEPDDRALIRCYQQCDLFALPNRQVGQDIEGFGMVLLEAQACGRPVLAGASGGTAETMKVPETGRIVPCEDPRQLAATVVELLSDPLLLGRMGDAARRWAVERFDWSALAPEAGRLFGIAPASGPAPAAGRVIS